MSSESSQDLRTWKLRIWIINVITLAWALAASSISTVLSQYAVVIFNSTPLEVGALWSVFFVVSLVIRPLVGVAFDIGYRYRSLILGASVFTLSSIIYLFASDFNHLILARVLQGLGQGLFITSSLSLAAYETFTHKEYFEESIAWRSSMIGIGIVLGPAMSGYIVSLYGYGQSFITIVLIGLSLILAILLTAKILRFNEKIFSLRRKDGVLLNSSADSITNVLSGFNDLIHISGFRRAIASSFLYNMGYTAITSFLPAYYADMMKQDAGIAVGNFMSLVGIASLIPRILTGKLSRHWSTWRTTVIGLIILFTSMILLGVNPLPPNSYILAAIAGVGLGFIIPSLQIMALKDNCDTRRGLASGLFVLGFDAANLASPLIYGTIGNIFGYEYVLKTAFIPVMITIFYLVL